MQNTPPTPLSDWIERAWGLVGMAVVGVGTWLIKTRYRNQAALQKIQAEQKATLERTLIEGVEKIPIQFQAVILEWQRILNEQKLENERCRRENDELRKDLDAMRDELDALRAQLHRLHARVTDTSIDGEM